MRNYTIAGAIGLGAILYVKAIEDNNFVSWTFFSITVILFTINAADGATWIYGRLMSYRFFSRGINYLLAFCVGLIYVGVALYFGTVVFIEVLNTHRSAL